MLINNINTLKEYIPTIVSGEFGKYQSYMADANKWISREILGSNLYGAIKDLTSIPPTQPEEGEPLPDHSALVARAEAVVANKGYLDAIPMLDLIQTESGFGVVRTDKVAPASPERVKALIDGTKQKLSDSIEELIDYLEDTASYHDDWKGSPAYSLLTDTYIQTLREFNRYYYFNGTRLEFVKFKPKLLEAINLKICPVISTELSDQIIEQLRDDELTTANKVIIEPLRYAMALFANGEDKSANSYLLRVRKIIMEKTDEYPAFQNSALYARIIATANTVNSGSLFRGAL